MYIYLSIRGSLSLAAVLFNYLTFTSLPATARYSHCACMTAYTRKHNNIFLQGNTRVGNVLCSNEWL